MEYKTFLNHLAKKTDLDLKEADAWVGAICQVVRGTCADMDSLAIPGFGTIQPVKSDEVIVTDSDGNRTLLPPSIKLTFKESVMLRKKFM